MSKTQQTRLELAKEMWEGRSNGAIEGMDAGKGGRVWLDGEFQLCELEALCIILRDHAGETAEGFDESIKIEYSDRLPFERFQEKRNEHIQHWLKNGEPVTLTCHKTGSDTYRLLFNGNVHPLWCGFSTAIFLVAAGKEAFGSELFDKLFQYKTMYPDLTKAAEAIRGKQ